MWQTIFATASLILTVIGLVQVKQRQSSPPDAPTQRIEAYSPPAESASSPEVSEVTWSEYQPALSETGSSSFPIHSLHFTGVADHR